MEILIFIAFIFLVIMTQIFEKSKLESKERINAEIKRQEKFDDEASNMSNMSDYQKFKIMMQDIRRPTASGYGTISTKNRTYHSNEWIELVESGYKKAVIETGKMFLEDDSEGGIFNDINEKVANKLANEGSVTYITAIAFKKLKDASIKLHGNFRNDLSYVSIDTRGIPKGKKIYSGEEQNSEFFSIEDMSNNQVLKQLEILTQASLSGNTVAAKIIDWFDRETEIAISKGTSEAANDAIKSLPFDTNNTGSGTGDDKRMEEINKNIGNNEDYTIYLVKIRSEIDGKLYLKIGVTKHEDVSIRFTEDETVKLEEVCGFHVLPKWLALKVEQSIIERYRPTNNADEAFDVYSRFSGYTEVLDMRKIKEIKNGFAKIPSWDFNLNQKINKIKQL